MPAEFAGMVGAVVRGRDKYGSGEWHASRDNGKRRHDGLDLVSVPGQPLLSMSLLRILRRADPYPDSKDATLTGVMLELLDPAFEGITMRLLYVEPVGHLFGKMCPPRVVIAHAQSLQHLYPGITNHVHVDMWLGGQRIDPTPYFIDRGEPAPGGAVTA
jgi:hypothetical protein